MSGSFSNKFSRKSSREDEKQQESEEKLEAGEGEATKRRRRAAKENPLLSAQTDNYVDDSDLYQPRLSRMQRYQYWQELQQNRGRRPLPKGFRGWITKEYETKNELSTFPYFYYLLFSIMKHRFWDQMYLNFLVLWLLLIAFFFDGWAAQLAPFLVPMNAGNQLLAIPPLLMFFTQLLPIIGALYFTNYCNDLVHFLAAKDFQKWACATALIAQYIEFFHYGGCGRSQKAGLCRYGHHTEDGPVRLFLRRYLTCMRHPEDSKVHPDEEEEDEEEEEYDEEDRSEAGGSENIDGDVNGVLDENADIEAGLDSSEAQLTSAPSVEIESNAPAISESKDSAEVDIEKGDEDHEDDGDGKKKKKKRRKKKKESKKEEVVEEEVVDTTEYLDWTCIVCNTENHKPRYGVVDADVVFGEVGLHYKRMYAKIQHRRNIPTCSKCFTYADYKPPMGSAHFFPHNPKPHIAFEDYPARPAIQSGLRIDAFSIYMNHIRSFFFGLRDDMRSGTMLNDWRLRKFSSDRFPEVPRYRLKAGEEYKLGEIVECKQQKFEWTRCRIILVRTNRTYDIRYDYGDELRFVAESLIRTRPEKRAFAYRVELGFVVIALLTPLGGAIGFLTGDYGFIMIGLVIVCALLLAIRLVTFVQYFYNYYAAGMFAILRLSAVFMLPLLFILIGSAMGLTSGSAPASWPTITVFFILGMFSSLPACYMMRPPYAIIGFLLFTQVAIGMYALSLQLNNPTAVYYIGIALAPFLTCALFMKYLRYNLHNIWDVCLVIRRKSDTARDNPSILGMCWDYISDCFDFM